MRRRIATYRLQLTPQNGFSAAGALAPYLADLGVSHLYASPYLQAARGSMHGYDVVDPGRINEELGGAEGRAELCKALTASDLGQLLDIVPNHMAIRGGHNAWWWDVLENGPASRYSGYFDVEWHSESDDTILLPILGDQYGVELEAGRIQLVRRDGAFLITYFEHEAPVAPRSLSVILSEAAEHAQSDQLAYLADSFDLLPLPSVMDAESRARRHRGKEVLLQWLWSLLDDSEDLLHHVDAVLGRLNADPDRLHWLLEAQNYRLAYWRVGNHELAYRRFFDIDSLVGLRVEDDEVFHATHRLILRWLADGSIDGVRIDHVDGLYDPEAYLRRLRAIAPEAWLLVEKILEGDEKLRPGWPVEGTTGYEFLNHAGRVLVDAAGEEPLTNLERELSLEPVDFATQVRRCKELVLDQALDSDLQRLVERLNRVVQTHRRHRDTARIEMQSALAELILAWPVYRAYTSTNQQEISDTDRHIIEQSCARAREERSDIDPRLFEFLKRLLLLEYRDDESVDFVMGFQQVTGPAMAKGLEDTAFYRHHRLVALNEVGGDPNHFSESIDDFHAFAQERQGLCPFALNATGSHDSKRSEDVRARLLTLSEAPDEWRDAIGLFRSRLRPVREELDVGGPLVAPDPDAEHMLWQNLIGAWPIDLSRMQQFATKALREAKRFTSWHRVHGAYEGAVDRYLSAIYEDDELLAEIERFVASIEDAGYCNSLGQVLLKMLTPGVPDLYQGTELWDFSLVDPDNRRPVDFDLRRKWLAELEGADAVELWNQRKDGRIKLHVTTQLLKLRTRRVDDVAGSYDPLKATGEQADRVLAFRRGGGVVGVATRLWKKHDHPPAAQLSLPAGAWRNVLTGTSGWQGTLDVAQLLGPLPVAALECTTSTDGAASSGQGAA